jgi:glutathione S-transferase
MVKLFYTSTSCGAGNFITAYLSGLNIECEQVDLATHKTASGVDFYTINPKGNVPAVVLDDGRVLNENAATLQYLADQDAEHKLLPAEGDVARYEVINALSYIGTEYHKTVGHLFNPTLSDDVKAYFQALSQTKLAFVNDNLLKDKTYLVGEKLSIADIYLYICLSWSGYINVDMEPYANVKAFFERVGESEGLKAAQAAMGASPATTAA